MTNVIEFKPKASKDVGFIIDDDDTFIGIAGKNFKMMFLKGEEGFLFNDKPISRKELIAFIWASDLWRDVQQGSEKE